jgi:hypothetical protein
MAENSIVVENLTYRYGNLFAVDYINFKVALYVGVLAAIILVMGLAIMNIVKRLSTGA